MKPSHFVLAVLLGATLATQAQEQPRVTQRLSIEDALRWRLASNPTISPDGRRVAFVVGESDFERSRVVTQLWWTDTETRQTRRLTQGEESASDPRWSPDGRWLAFLSARGGEPPAKRRPQVWLLPVDGGEAYALTRVAEGVRHFRWAPDGKSIFYVTQEALPKGAEQFRERQQQRKFDARIVDEEKFRNEIWRITIEDQKAERVFAGDLGLDSIEPSPDGKWLVYRTNYTGDPDDTRKYDLWLLNLPTGQPQQLTKRGGEESSPVWSPDSLRLAFLAPRLPELTYSQPEVFLVALPPGAQPPEPQRLTKDFVGNVERLHWSKGNSILFAGEVRTGNRLFSLNPADGAVRPSSPEAVFITQPDWTSDGTACVALQEGPLMLPEVVILRPTTPLAEPQKLTDLNPQLKQFALGTQEVIRWKSKDGTEIEGILTRPPDWQPTQKYSLLLDIHGGPYGRRTNTLTSGGFPQAWAARGWLVLQPNFRGSSGYGNEFGLASRGDIGGRDYEDILAGVDFVLAQGWGDEKHMAVLGGSYGGYMTNLIIGRSKRFQAAVSMFGLFSLVTDFSNSEFPSWELDYLAKYYWDDLQLYLDRSPMKHVKDMTTPVLILHGDDDNNTFISNSKEMYQALKALGRTVKFARLPREGHGFREPNHLIEQFRLASAWLEEHALSGSATRVREMLEAVRSGAWELRVTAVRTPASYGGIVAKGRFIEVEVLLRAVEPTQERLSVLVFDTAGSEISLTAGAQAVYPAGLVTESLGEKLLVKSSGQVVAVLPDKDGNHRALALTVAFDAPADAREFILKVKEFPPMRIDLPLEKK